MSGQVAQDDTVSAAGALLAPLGETILADSWARQFGGNARVAYRFDTCSQDGRILPRILLSQVAGKHVASDTGHEYAVLHAMNGSNVRAPAAVALDASGHVTGAPAIVLERKDGEADAVRFLRRDALSGRALSEDLARATAGLHLFDWRSAGLSGSADPIMDEIRRWEDEFLSRRLEPLPMLAWLFGWLRQNQPAPVRLALVHGDLRPGNFLYEGDVVATLLDWEMAHIGDPAEDIAWIYRALWSPERFLPLADFLAIYAEEAGIAIPWRTILYYRIFNEAKFAVISLAAAHSVASGGTRNLRHIDRAAKVPECLRLALGWIEEIEGGVHDAAA